MVIFIRKQLIQIKDKMIKFDEVELPIKDR